jgi:hypothetical protein
MTASQERAQREADPSGVSPVSMSASPSVKGVMVFDTVINDDFACRCPDDLDAEAAYYRHRAIQEEQALGPGYYVDLLRGMATKQAAMAQWLRTGNGAT